jgi:hypothetical protein
MIKGNMKPVTALIGSIFKTISKEVQGFWFRNSKERLLGTK